MAATQASTGSAGYGSAVLSVFGLANDIYSAQRQEAVLKQALKKAQNYQLSGQTDAANAILQSVGLANFQIQPYAATGGTANATLDMMMNPAGAGGSFKPFFLPDAPVRKDYANDNNYQNAVKRWVSELKRLNASAPTDTPMPQDVSATLAKYDNPNKQITTSSGPDINKLTQLVNDYNRGQRNSAVAAGYQGDVNALRYLGDKADQVPAAPKRSDFKSQSAYKSAVDKWVDKIHEAGTTFAIPKKADKSIDYGKLDQAVNDYNSQQAAQYQTASQTYQTATGSMGQPSAQGAVSPGGLLDTFDWQDYLKQAGLDSGATMAQFLQPEKTPDQFESSLYKPATESASSASSPQNGQPTATTTPDKNWLGQQLEKYTPADFARESGSPNFSLSDIYTGKTADQLLQPFGMSPGTLVKDPNQVAREAQIAQGFDPSQFGRSVGNLTGDFNSLYGVDNKSFLKDPNQTSMEGVKGLGFDPSRFGRSVDDMTGAFDSRFGVDSRDFLKDPSIAANQKVKDLGFDPSRFGRSVNDLTGDFGSLYKIDPSQLLQDPTGFKESPGYQWMRDQGMKAVQGSAAAKGALNSGATLKALQEYGTGLADQDYSDWWNRQAGMKQMGLGQLNQYIGQNQTNSNQGLGALQNLTADQLAYNAQGLGQLNQYVGQNQTNTTQGLGAMQNLAGNQLAYNNQGLGAINNFINQNQQNTAMGIGAGQNAAGNRIAFNNQGLGLLNNEQANDLVNRKMLGQTYLGEQAADAANKQTNLAQYWLDKNYGTGQGKDALNWFNTLFNQDQAGKTTLYNMLKGQQGVGYDASSNIANNWLGQGANLAGIFSNAGNINANTAMGLGQNSALGYQGVQSALNNFYTNLGSAMGGNMGGMGGNGQSTTGANYNVGGTASSRSPDYFGNGIQWGGI